MKQVLAVVAVFSTVSCTTTTERLAAKEPFEVVHSKKARDIVADCLLNRVTSDEIVPSREVGPNATTLEFNGRGLARKPGIYNFVIRDEGSGSAIEVRRFASSSLAAAETCF
jgi:hypothetical protein